MKTIRRPAIVMLAVTAIFLSCKQGQSPAEEAAVTEEASVPANLKSGNAIGNSEDTLRKVAENRKFIRTADLKFKVKEVAKSTNIIENATRKFGGLVTSSNLKSTISDRQQVQFSQDSTMITTRYTVANDLTIRVPNSQLDTVVKSIAAEIDFLDLRVIKADDVSLQLLSNQLAQSRSRVHEKRLETAIDSKGKKLTPIVDAEDNLDSYKENSDNKKLENLALRDKVAFSTLTLQIYQAETARREMAMNVAAYRPNIGLQLRNGIETGWYILESILGFVVQLWSLILLTALVFFGYKKLLRKTKPAV